MVMVVFKSVVEEQKSLQFELVKNFEEQGRNLFAKYAYDCEELAIYAKNWSDEQVCLMAFGALLEDYFFDKYNEKKAIDYPKLETLIFLVDKPIIMKNKFEKYVAIANAVRFAKDLFNEPNSQYLIEQYFFETKRLEYLGLGFKDCGNNLLRLSWKKSDDLSEIVIVASERAAAAVVAGVMKVIALMQYPVNVLGYLKIDGVLNDFLRKNSIYVKEGISSEAEIEQEVLRIYEQIVEKKDA